jgi:hypothetical protein
MNQLIIIALFTLSLNAQADFSERAELRNELTLALDTNELNGLEAPSRRSLWYLNTIMIDVAPYVSFKVPGLAGLKITPIVRIVLKRNLKDGFQDYNPNKF